MNPLTLVLLAATLVYAQPAPKGQKKPSPKPKCAAASAQKMVSGRVSRDRAEMILAELIAVSSIDSPDSLKTANRKPTKVVFVDKTPLVEGSPAIAVAARMGPNTSDANIILMTVGLLELAQSDAEVAFILAHEVSHLAGTPDHAALKQQSAMALVDKVLAAHPEILKLSEADSVKAIQSDTMFKRESEKYSRELEDEADANGLNLMGQIRDLSTGQPYDRAAAAESMEHAKAWLACIKDDKDDIPDLAHDPIEKRVASLRARAAQMAGAGTRINTSVLDGAKGFTK